jgi:Ca-activated chloride channel homolog
MSTSTLIRARSVCALRALLFFFPAICLIAGRTQEAPPSASIESSAKISVDVRLVVLRASVRDKGGGSVPGLQERNFRVDEDGRPQTIRVVHEKDVPVAVGLVIDNSGSMNRKRSDVTAAAVAFARASNPGDEMFVVNFNEHVTLGLPDTRLFSASAAELEGALRKPVPAGRTALYDAIGEALAHLQKSAREKKVLVVFSDGGDNASKHTLSQVLQDIGRSDTAIYTIGLFDEEDSDRNPGVLRRIANAGGGEAFLPGMPSEAARICERIAEDIRTQYTISYSPSNRKPDNKYRTIKVTATGSYGAKLRVRTRAGYIASPSAAEARQ